MVARIHTYEEVVHKLEAAQQEIRRLNDRPDHAVELKNAREENLGLRAQLNKMVKQRDEIWGCLKPRLEKDGILPKEGEEDDYWKKRAAARTEVGRHPSEV